MDYLLKSILSFIAAIAVFAPLIWLLNISLSLLRSFFYFSKNHKTNKILKEKREILILVMKALLEDLENIKAPYPKTLEIKYFPHFTKVIESLDPLWELTIVSTFLKNLNLMILPKKKEDKYIFLSKFPNITDEKKLFSEILMIQKCVADLEQGKYKNIILKL